MLFALLERLDELSLVAVLVLLAGAFAKDLEDVLRDTVLLLLEVAFFAPDLCVLLACGFLYSAVLLDTVLLLGVCVTVLLETDFRCGVLVVATVLFTSLRRDEPRTSFL